MFEVIFTGTCAAMLCKKCFFLTVLGLSEKTCRLFFQLAIFRDMGPDARLPLPVSI